MKTRIKQIAAATKDHVVRNRAKYAVVGTSIAFLALMRGQSRTFNAFIAEHDLTDEWLAELTQSAG